MLHPPSKTIVVTLQDLQQRCADIDTVVNQTIKSSNENTYPITDGIFAPELYHAAKYKILWILKEPYDVVKKDGTFWGGNWSVAKEIGKKKSIGDFKGGLRTFRPMMYTVYGILNDFCLYNKKEFEQNAPAVLNAFQGGGYINVKKLPGRKGSDERVIGAAYREYKAILHRQLADYNPDIIIGGSTLHHFFRDLNIEAASVQREGSVAFAIQNGKVYIDAYHPVQRKLTRERYCNDIIKAAKHWAQTLL